MPSELTKQQVEDYRQLLKKRFIALRNEIRQELLSSDNEQFIDLAGQVYDLEEGSVADLLVDLKLASIDRHVEEIRDVDSALIRIAENNYGVCIDCNAPISAERLSVYPTAKRCIRCQEMHEKSFAQPGKASI